MGKKIRNQFGGNLQAFVSGGGALDQNIGEFLNQDLHNNTEIIGRFQKIENQISFSINFLNILGQYIFTFFSDFYIVDPKIVIKIYNISTLHKNMYVLKYSILNSFAQNPAISTFF